MPIDALLAALRPASPAATGDGAPADTTAGPFAALLAALQQAAPPLVAPTPALAGAAQGPVPAGDGGAAMLPGDALGRATPTPVPPPPSTPLAPGIQDTGQKAGAEPGPQQAPPPAPPAGQAVPSGGREGTVPAQTPFNTLQGLLSGIDRQAPSLAAAASGTPARVTPTGGSLDAVNRSPGGQDIQPPIAPGAAVKPAAAKAGPATPITFPRPAGAPAPGAPGIAAREPLLPIAAGEATPLDPSLQGGADIEASGPDALERPGASPSGPPARAGAAPTPTLQVAFEIAKGAGQRLERMHVHLEPAELGEVEIRLDFGNQGRVRMMITAEQPETLELLQRDAAALERSLQDAGLRPESGGLSFSLRRERGSADEHGGQRRGPDAGGAAGDAPADAAPAPQWRAGNHLIDLRV